MNKVFALTLFGIFFVPISCVIPMNGMELWYTQFIALFSLFCFGVSLVVWDRSKGISLFIMACLFSAIFVSKQNPKALILLTQVCFSSLLMYGISCFSEKQRKIILWSVFIFILLQGSYVVVQYFGLDPIFNKLDKSVNIVSQDDTVGFAGSHNQSGLMFATTMPILLGLFPYVSLLSVFGLFCSTTIIACIATVVGSGFYVYHRHRRWLMVFVVLVGLGGSVYFTKVESLSVKPILERYLVAKHSISATISGKVRVYALMLGHDWQMYRMRGIPDGVVTTKPWLGYGLGNFTKIFPYSQIYINSAHRYSHAHNDLVETFVELGLPGLIAVLITLIEFVWYFICSHKTKILVISASCILTHFICSLGVFSVHTATSGLLLIIYVGLFLGEIREVRGGEV